MALIAACGSEVGGGGGGDTSSSSGSSGGGGGSGSATSSSGSSGGSTSSSGGGGGSASSSSGAGGGQYCYSPAATLPFNRTCKLAADCALKLHMIDCCGSLAAVGINMADAAAFDAEEMNCFSLCDCLSKPTIADDGKTSPDNAAFAVSCVSGQCYTSVP